MVSKSAGWSLGSSSVSRNCVKEPYWDEHLCIWAGRLALEQLRKFMGFEEERLVHFLVGLLVTVDGRRHVAVCQEAHTVILLQLVATFGAEDSSGGCFGGRIVVEYFVLAFVDEGVVDACVLVEEECDVLIGTDELLLLEPCLLRLVGLHHLRVLALNSLQVLHVFVDVCVLFVRHRLSALLLSK